MRLAVAVIGYSQLPSCYAVRRLPNLLKTEVGEESPHHRVFSSRNVCASHNCQIQARRFPDNMIHQVLLDAASQHPTTHQPVCNLENTCSGIRPGHDDGNQSMV